MKLCPCCKQHKDLNQFGKNKNTKDGHSCYCKACANHKGQKYIATANKIAERKQLGLCTGCGKNAADFEYVTCSKCRSSRTKTRHLRRQRGNCVDCGQIDGRGQSYCQKCANKRKEKQGYFRRRIRKRFSAENKSYVCFAGENN